MLTWQHLLTRYISVYPLHTNVCTFFKIHLVNINHKSLQQHYRKRILKSTWFVFAFLIISYTNVRLPMYCLCTHSGACHKWMMISLAATFDVVDVLPHMPVKMCFIVTAQAKWQGTYTDRLWDALKAYNRPIVHYSYMSYMYSDWSWHFVSLKFVIWVVYAVGLQWLINYNRCVDENNYNICIVLYCNAHFINKSLKLIKLLTVSHIRK